MRRFFWRIGCGTLALALAAAIWLPCVHFFFMKPAGNFRNAGVSPEAQALVARHMELWTKPELLAEELAKMRRTNAEWDFMGRTFLSWSLANIGLRDANSKPECLRVMDAIIAETLRLEQEKGMYVFLMPYAKGRSYVQQPARSQFLDGEIALMLGLRRLLEEKVEYRGLMEERVKLIASRMEANSLLSTESYPDECWIFDNVVSLAAVKVADRLDGGNHADLIQRWLSIAKTKLTDAKTGLLISSFTMDGTHLDGPEGSSIWFTAHVLQLLDPELARDQYNRAKKELSRNVMGFGYSREWPMSWVGSRDVDSGMVIPVLEISAGGSGMALIGAAAFEDADYLDSLVRTLDLAAFPSRQNGRLKYCASNQVGDAALLYASVVGPAWNKILEKTP